MKKILVVFLVLVLIPFLKAYEPQEWNLEAREAFAKQRFGIFVHWGIYSLHEKGEWYQQVCKVDDGSYEKIMEVFNPTNFNANEWIKLFRRAGAKYLTITSRHHDGFSIWPTKVDDGYNIANTKFTRDPLAELSKACQKEGVQLNFYYSLMDWHREDYPAGYKCARLHPLQKGDYDSYKKYMLGQIAELIDSYHPGVIWFDGEWDHTDWKYDILPKTLDWDFDSIYDLIHSKKVLVANNHHRAIRDKEDIQLFERDNPGDKSNALFSRHQKVSLDRPLEQCDMLQGAWGYNRDCKVIRDANNVVALLARAASKGANLLLNVAPDGTGRIPEDAVKVLNQVGDWMEKNGESIYGTDGSEIGKGRDIVSTRRDNQLYLHFLNPEVNSFSFYPQGPIKSVELLATKEELFTSNIRDGRMSVHIKRADGDKSDVVVKITYGDAPYCIVDLSGGTDAKRYPITYDYMPDGGWKEEHKTTKLVLRRISAGKFRMGSPKSEIGRAPMNIGEEDLHMVAIGDDYYIGVFEVTQKQWELVMGEARGFHRGDTHPLEDASWEDIRGRTPGARGFPVVREVGKDSFLGRLSVKTGLSFDLPTEAQWEYACRAGSKTAYAWGDTFNQTKACANKASSHSSVGSYEPNAWGLYDMHGNVAEWCLDWYMWGLGNESVENPTGATNGTARVLRGGSWRQTPGQCRSASRSFDSPSYGSRDDGFRVVFPLR